MKKLTPENLKPIVKNDSVIFVLYSGGIIKEELLNLPGAEFLNAHMGNVPRYRGMNVIEWAVLEDTKPKVSVMVMNSKIDDGDVICSTIFNTKF